MGDHGRSLREVLTRQFLAVGLLPLLAVVAVAAVVLVPILTKEARQRQMELAIAIRDQVAAQLIHHQHSATIVARHLERSATDDSAARDLLQSIVQTDPIVLAVYRVDPRGEVTAAAIQPDSGRSEADAIGLDVSAQPYFIEARRRMVTVWSDVFVSTLTGKLTAMLVVPEGASTLLMELSLESLSHSLAAISRTRSTATSIVDRQGRLVAHPDVTQALQQHRLAAIASALPAARQGSAALTLGQSSWVDDHVLLLPVAPIGWTVVVSQPVTVTLAPVLLLGASLAVIIVLTGVLSLAAARRYARRTGGQVERLASAAAQVARHEGPATAPEFDVRELGALWRHLQALFEQLRERDQSLQAALRDLTSVLDTARLVAIYTTDLDGRVTLFNAGTTLMLGLPTGAAPRQPDALRWLDPGEVELAASEAGVPGAPTRVLLDALVGRSSAQGHESREWTVRRDDGSALAVSIAITPLLNADGTRKGYLFVGVDVSERKRAAELEVAHRVAQLSSQAKSEFLSRMSHELRTPLNAILGFAELLLSAGSQDLLPVQRERLRYIHEAGWHLLHLLNDVLDLARIESGSMKVETLPIALGDLLPRAARLAQAAITANEVHLHLDSGLACRSARVIADETRLTQVLVNLLSNAAKYNRRGGLIEVSCSLGADGVQLHVRDTGPGMTADQLLHLFEPFNRLGRERSRVEGTGIGLVISKHLIELMGGTLTVSSEVGQGSVFTLRLPTADALPAELPAPAQAPLPAQPAPAPHARQVLYIEDNVVNIALMQAVLEQRQDIALSIAERATEALDRVRASPPDLILLDMHLPDADGLDVLRRLDSDERLRGIPVVAVTADALADSEAAALAAGARAYLRKPLRMDETLDVIDRMLAASEVGAD